MKGWFKFRTFDRLVPTRENKPPPQIIHIRKKSRNSHLEKMPSDIKYPQPLRQSPSFFKRALDPWYNFLTPGGQLAGINTCKDIVNIKQNEMKLPIFGISGTIHPRTSAIHFHFQPQQDHQKLNFNLFYFTWYQLNIRGNPDDKRTATQMLVFQSIHFSFMRKWEIEIESWHSQKLYNMWIL